MSDPACGSCSRDPDGTGHVLRADRSSEDRAGGVAPPLLGQVLAKSPDRNCSAEEFGCSIVGQVDVLGKLQPLGPIEERPQCHDGAAGTSVHPLPVVRLLAVGDAGQQVAGET